MILDTKLDFNLYLKNVQSKGNKTIGLLRKLENILPTESLIATYKSFIRPHLGLRRLYSSKFLSDFWTQNVLIPIYQ